MSAARQSEVSSARSGASALEPFGDSLSAPSRGGQVGSSGDGPARHTPPAIPGYTVVRKLGAGGQGQVWLAICAATGRKVALKLLDRRHLADSHARARFEGDYRALNSLDHPGIVRGIELGELPGGELWYAMECVSGVTLRESLGGVELAGVLNIVMRNPVVVFLFALGPLTAVWFGLHGIAAALMARTPRRWLRVPIWIAACGPLIWVVTSVRALAPFPSFVSSSAWLLHAGVLLSAVCGARALHALTRAIRQQSTFAETGEWQ